MSGSFFLIHNLSKSQLLYRQIGPPSRCTGASLNYLLHLSQPRHIFGSSNCKSKSDGFHNHTDNIQASTQNDNYTDDEPSNFKTSKINSQTLTNVDSRNTDEFTNVLDNKILIKQSKLIRQSYSKKKSAAMGLKAPHQFNPSKYFKQSWQNRYNHIPGMTQRGVQKSSSLENKTGSNQRLAKTQNGVESERDVFGTLSTAESKRFHDLRHPNERIDEMLSEDLDEPRDRRLDIPLTRDGRIGKNAYYYTRKISILAREGKIREAIAIFDHWMMVRDRVMPNKRTFVTLIGILGRVGYTKKAFELFGKMKRLGLDPEDHIFTSLFNACANCPSQVDGLKRAQDLLHDMRVKGMHPNLFTVKAAMKALAICGDFPQAFVVMDEASKRLALDAECFNALLIACISDKKTGFRRALQVWQKMVEYNVQPATNTYNLLIRSARDCGIGDPASFASALNLQISSNGKFKEDIGLLGTGLEQNDTGQTDRILLPGIQSQIHDLNFGSDGSKTVIEDGIHQGFLESLQHTDREEFIEITALESGNNVKKEERNSLIETEHQSIQDNYEENFSVDDSGSNFHHSHNFYNGDSSFDTDFAAMLSQTEALGDEDSAKIYEWWEEEPSDAQIDFRPSCTASSDLLKSNYSDIVTNHDCNGTEESRGEQSLSLKDLKKSSRRLALLGGASKLVAHMKKMGAHPDIKTYSQILSCLPDNEQSEFELLTLMEETGMEPDTDFLNTIMMRRNKRHMSDTVKAILPIMSKLRLTPNMRTYAALALTCHKEKQAEELLEDMKDANLEPNTVIMNHLIYISRTNFAYKLRMLKAMEEIGLCPNKETIGIIENSVAITKRKIVQMENSKDTASFYLSESFQGSLQHFLRFYKSWLLRTEFEKSKHPWEAFQSSTDPAETRQRSSLS